jgi:hypothetical protein
MPVAHQDRQRVTLTIPPKNRSLAAEKQANPKEKQFAVGPTPSCATRFSGVLHHDKKKMHSTNIFSNSLSTILSFNCDTGKIQLVVRTPKNLGPPSETAAGFGKLAGCLGRGRDAATYVRRHSGHPLAPA